MEGIPVGVSAARSSIASLRGENWARRWKTTRVLRMMVCDRNSSITHLLDLVQRCTHENLTLSAILRVILVILNSASAVDSSCGLLLLVKSTHLKRALKPKIEFIKELAVALLLQRASPRRLSQITC